MKLPTLALTRSGDEGFVLLTSQPLGSPVHALIISQIMILYRR